MSLKSKLVSTLVLLIISFPIKAQEYSVDMHLQRIIPENLAVIKNEYSSIVISFFMEQCIVNLNNAFNRNRIHPLFSRKASFQICGCSMDSMRNDMPEDDYLDMLYNRNQMAQAMMDSNLKMCGEMYGEYYSKTLKQDPQT